MDVVSYQGLMQVGEAPQLQEKLIFTRPPPQKNLPIVDAEATECVRGTWLHFTALGVTSGAEPEAGSAPHLPSGARPGRALHLQLSPGAPSRGLVGGSCQPRSAQRSPLPPRDCSHSGIVMRPRDARAGRPDPSAPRCARRREPVQPRRPEAGPDADAAHFLARSREPRPQQRCPAHAAGTSATPTERRVPAPRTICQQRPAVGKGWSLDVSYREKWSSAEARTGAGALQRPPRREGGCRRGRRGRASDAKLARRGRAAATPSCERPEVWCEGRPWSALCRAAASLGPGSWGGCSGPAAPRLPGTEGMGDSKEAGAEAPPAGATARGGLSLLSQGESEEPSAQVRPPRGATAGLRARGRDVRVPGGLGRPFRASRQPRDGVQPARSLPRSGVQVCPRIRGRRFPRGCRWGRPTPSVLSASAGERRLPPPCSPGRARSE